MSVEVGKHLGAAKSDSRWNLENLCDTFYYVPLLKQLEALLNNEIILRISGTFRICLCVCEFYYTSFCIGFVSPSLLR